MDSDNDIPYTDEEIDEIKDELEDIAWEVCEEVAEFTGGDPDEMMENAREAVEETPDLDELSSVKEDNDEQ